MVKYYSYTGWSGGYVTRVHEDGRMEAIHDRQRLGDSQGIITRDRSIDGADKLLTEEEAREMSEGWAFEKEFWKDYPVADPVLGKLVGDLTKAWLKITEDNKNLREDNKNIRRQLEEQIRDKSRILKDLAGRPEYDNQYAPLSINELDWIEKSTEPVIGLWNQRKRIRMALEAWQLISTGRYEFDFDRETVPGQVKCEVWDTKKREWLYYNSPEEAIDQLKKRK